MAPDNYADSQKGTAAGSEHVCVCRGSDGAATVLFSTEFAFEDDSDGRTYSFLTIFLTYPLSTHTHLTLKHHRRTLKTLRPSPRNALYCSLELKRSLIFCCDFKVAQASYTPI